MSRGSMSLFAPLTTDLDRVLVQVHGDRGLRVASPQGDLDLWPQVEILANTSTTTAVWGKM